MDPPYPFAYAHKDEFFALPPEEQPPHIWECLQYLEWRRGIGDVSEEDIDKERGIMRHVACDVAKALAAKLREERAYKNRFDPRWPRFHPNSKDPLYLTGCYPPLCMCLPDTDEDWNHLGSAGGSGEDNMREFADWFSTPAARHVITDEERAEAERMVADYEQTVETARRAQTEAEKADRAFLQAQKNLQKAMDDIQRGRKS